MKKRINYIDIARAFAIIFIVLGHTLVHSEHCSIIFKFLYSFHVVLFFIISGYTFRIKDNEKFIIFVKNKFIRIMIPYFVWAILFLIPYLLFGRSAADSLDVNSTFSLKKLLFNIFYGNGNLNALKQNSSLWFLPALFSMELLYFYIIKLIDKYKNSVFFILIVSFIICYFSNYLNTYSIYFPLGLNTALNLGLFFLLGYIIKNYNIILIISKWYYTLILFIIGFVAFYFNNGISCIDYIYGNFFLMILSGLCLSLVVINISKLINHNNVLEYIGRNTMGILIFHKLIVLIFQTKLGFISKLLINSNVFIELLLSFIIVIVSIVFSLIISNILKRIFPLVIGENKNNLILKD